MNPFRIALANVRFPATRDESISLAEQAIAQSATEHASLICFPECFVPGYRAMGKPVAPPDAAFLERAWSAVQAAAAKANVTVVLGTERFIDEALTITALVINSDGTVAGFQDKVQIDPSEERTYSPGSGRRIFQSGPLTFGAIRKPSGGRPGAAPKSCSILIFMKPNPAVSLPPPSPIPQTHSTKKRCCAAPPRTPAISRP
jgi:predicted amidohydrolase